MNIIAIVLFLLAITLYFFEKKWLFFVFLALMGAFYFTKSDRYFGWTNEAVKKAEPIISDGAGYYAYMPQWYIYHTDNFEFLPQIGKTYGSSRFTDNIYFDVLGKARNKYYTGTALSMSPFFLVGHLYAKSSEYPPDGYSKPYQFMVNIAGIFYFLFGSLGLFFLLRRYKIRMAWIALLVFGIGLGTNLSYFVNVLSPYSHVFSFAVVAWLLYFTKCWADEGKGKFFIWMCFFLGWAAIIRPTNMLVVAFLPFMFTSTAALWERIKPLFGKQKWYLVAGMVAFLGFIFFQLWSTYSQSGKFALNTYDAETFEFLTDPKIVDVLFSWRKGLFIFTPILLLMLPGWIVLYRKERRLFWGSLLFFSVFTYITASWWCWWYGGGLGMRPYIDVLAILFIPLAFTLEYMHKFVRPVYIGFIALFCWMYQVYEFQMKNNILHYDNMTYEQFARVFMQDDLRFGWCLHLQYEALPEKQLVTAREHPFMRLGKPVNATTFYKLKGFDYNDNPEVKIYSDSTYANNYFAARVQADVYLYTGETNPTFEAFFFKGDSVFHKSQFFIGQFIPEVNKLCPITVDFYPGFTYAQFDSVNIRFEEGNTFTGVKNLKIRELIFK